MSLSRKRLIVIATGAGFVLALFLMRIEEKIVFMSEETGRPHHVPKLDLSDAGNNPSIPRDGEVKVKVEENSRQSFFITEKSVDAIIKFQKCTTMGASFDGAEWMLKRSPPTVNSKCGGGLTTDRGFPLLCDYPIGEFVAYEFSKIVGLFVPEVRPLMLLNELFETHLLDYREGCAGGSEEVYLSSEVMRLLKITWVEPEWKLGIFSAMKMESDLEELPATFLNNLGGYVMDHVKNVPDSAGKLLHRWADTGGVKISTLVSDNGEENAALVDQVVDAFAFDFIVDNCDRFSSSRKEILFEMGWDRLLPCTTAACKRWGLSNYNEKNFLRRGDKMVLIDNGKALHGFTFLDNSVEGNRKRAKKVLFEGSAFPNCAITSSMLDKLYDILFRGDLISDIVRKGSSLGFMTRKDERDDNWEVLVENLITDYLAAEGEGYQDSADINYVTTNRTEGISLPTDFESYEYVLMGLDHRSNILLEHAVLHCFSCGELEITSLDEKFDSASSIAAAVNNFGASDSDSGKYFHGCLLFATTGVPGILGDNPEMHHAIVNDRVVYDQLVGDVDGKSGGVSLWVDGLFRGRVCYNWAANFLATADRQSGKGTDLNAGFMALYLLLTYGKREKITDAQAEMISSLLNGKKTRLYDKDPSTQYHQNDILGGGIKEIDYGRKFAMETVAIEKADLMGRVGEKAMEFLRRYMEFNNYRFEPPGVVEGKGVGEVEDVEVEISKWW